MVESKPKLNEQALMKMVACDRSHEAFSALAQKYQQPAFALSYRITQNSDLAEDAVQEALLQMWRRASTFDMERKVWPWFARIVARVSIKQYQRKNRAPAIDLGEADTDFASLERAKDAREGLANLENMEQTTILNRALSHLPTHERQLLSLYYGAKMSQYEISAALSIPQRKISHQLTHALESIRSTLRKSGYVGALAIPSLSEAILLGPKPPQALLSNVLKNMEAPGVSFPRPMITVVFLVAATVGMLALPSAQRAFQSNQAEGKNFLNPGSNESLKTEDTKTLSTGLAYHWHAENGPPGNLEVRHGRWHYDDKKKAMIIGHEGVLLLMPVTLNMKPYVLEMRGGRRDNLKLYTDHVLNWKYGWSMRRARNDTLFPFSEYRKKNYRRSLRPMLHAIAIAFGRWQYYIKLYNPNPEIEKLNLEQRLTYYFADKARYSLDSVTHFDKDVPLFTPTLEFGDMYVTEIHLQTFDLALLPENLKDPQKVRGRLSRYKEVGAQTVPAIKKLFHNGLRDH